MRLGFRGRCFCIAIGSASWHGRFTAVHRRLFERGAKSTLPEHGAEHVAAVSGKRAKRTFAVGRTRLVAGVTVFNVLNASTVITQVATFGAALGTPTSIIPGRLPRLGLQVSF